MIDPGKYRARVVDAGMSKTKAGRERAEVDFAVEGETLTWAGYFGDNVDSGGKSLTERTFDALRACGLKDDDLSRLHELAGGEASVTVEHEEYEGKTRAKIRFVNPLRARMAPEEAKAFAQRMRDKIKGRNGTTTPPPSERQPGEDDEKLPF